MQTLLIHFTQKSFKIIAFNTIKNYPFKYVVYVSKSQLITHEKNANNFCKKATLIKIKFK